MTINDCRMPAVVTLLVTVDGAVVVDATCRAAVLVVSAKIIVTKHAQLTVSAETINMLDITLCGVAQMTLH